MKGSHPVATGSSSSSVQWNAASLKRGEAKGASTSTASCHPLVTITRTCVVSHWRLACHLSRATDLNCCSASMQPLIQALRMPLMLLVLLLLLVVVLLLLLFLPGL